jgi:Flp pilus assembly protein TadG
VAERGSTMVETAFVMTALLTVLLGIIDFGRALYTYSFVAQLARQGARWAIVRGSTCAMLDHCPAQSGSTDIQPYIQGLSYGATTAGNIHANLSFPGSNCAAGASGGGSNAPGCVAMVTVGYQFNFMLPFMPQPTMSSTSEMVISQ